MQDSIEISNIQVIPPGSFSFGGGASVEADVTNNSTTPISSVRVIGVYADPNRSIPYSDHEYLFLFDGGLEPGETKNDSSTPSGMGRLEKKENANMSLQIIEVEGPNDEEIISLEESPSELRSELESVNSERDSLKAISFK